MTGRGVDYDTGRASAKTATRPIYLIEVYFPAPLFHSTGPLVKTLGRTYNSVGTSMRSVSAEGATISFNNTDLSASALFLGRDIRDTRCRILKTYLPVDGVAAYVPAFYALAPHGTTGREYMDAPAGYAFEPVVIMDGTLDAVSSVRQQEVVVTALGTRRDVAWTPRIFIAPPLCNHMVPVDAKIGPNSLLESLLNG